ncbi:hypothetical protein GF389_01105 [Candidatus Dojkabacteria bacterium]|nr:hypothetical protein [Candidatus Dojkabacteria bacterium]
MTRSLILLKKSQKYLVRIALSLLVAITIYFVISLFESPINKVFESEKFELNFDYTITQNESDVQGISNSKQDPAIINTNKSTKLEIGTLDSRAWVFDQYLRQNDSPLAGHGEDFVNACDKYNTPRDCTLLIAIAKVETDLCKTGISARQYNCWGYGGSGENRIEYSSFQQAIDDITGRLMNGYRARFFEDPEAGELFYCGSHCNTWGDKVKEVQNQLKKYAEELGYGLE